MGGRKEEERVGRMAEGGMGRGGEMERRRQWRQGNMREGSGGEMKRKENRKRRRKKGRGRVEMWGRKRKNQEWGRREDCGGAAGSHWFLISPSANPSRTPGPSASRIKVRILSVAESLAWKSPGITASVFPVLLALSRLSSLDHSQNASSL